MALVDYSDSETSDVEDGPVAKAPAASRSKNTFTKVVDRSNPGKIKVSLPQPSLKQESNGEEPPAKRVRTNGPGVFGGFNSFLPPPKRTAQTLGTSLGRGESSSVPVGAKINFKTGAAPAFERGGDLPDFYGANGSGDAAVDVVLQNKPAEEVKLVGKPTMFRPLSVTRKPAKKKTVASLASSDIQPKPAPVVAQLKEGPPKQKVSLFSMSTEVDDHSQTTSSTSQDYQPLVYTNNPQDILQEDSQDFQASYSDLDTPSASQFSIPPAAPTPPVSQSLSDIAGDLNLSAAERRQLFGRQKNGPQKGQSVTKVINFNTDQEYLHNEELRAAGETVTHNPVRAIAPGKHSLKQLVNAAQNQREALEESFAKGKSNRAEASSRYGW